MLNARASAKSNKPVDAKVDAKATELFVSTVQDMIRQSMEEMMGQVHERSRRLQADVAIKLRLEAAKLRDSEEPTPVVLVDPPVSAKKSPGQLEGIPSEIALSSESSVEEKVSTLKKAASKLTRSNTTHSRRGTEPAEDPTQPQPAQRSPSAPSGEARLLNVPSTGSRMRRGASIGISNANSVCALNSGSEEEDRSRVPVGSDRQQKGVFADASAMKEKIRQAVAQKEYSVMDYYWETGICQAIARSNAFDSLTLLVIACNALWIAVDTDLNHDDLLVDAQLPFVIAENLFCLFFSLELLVRFLSFERKINAVKDAWFCFDSVLVAMMVLETWVLSLFFIIFSTGAGGSAGHGVSNTSVLKLVRLVRLTRMARMARLLRAVPELIILIKGIWVASRSVIFTLLLLVMIMYIFAVVFRQVVGQFVPREQAEYVTEEYFRSVPHSMFSLMVYGVIPDMAQIVIDCSDSHEILGIIIVCFILLASLTVMNMLVGVLCEVVSVVSSVEKEELTVTYVKSQLLQMFSNFNAGEGLITQQEFDELLMMPHAAKAMQDIGVDVVGLVDFSDYIFQDGLQLSFVDLMELVLQLRGSNSSTVKDVVDLRRYVMKELCGIQDALLAILEAMDSPRATAAARKSLRRVAHEAERPSFPSNTEVGELNMPAFAYLVSSSEDEGATSTEMFRYPAPRGPTSEQAIFIRAPVLNAPTMWDEDMLEEAV